MTASVYLCGFMGCGKSHIGRLLAAELGRELVDLDKVIVDREGMSIPEIFEKFGEPHFRKSPKRSISANSAEVISWRPAAERSSTTKPQNSHGKAGSPCT